MLTVQHLRDLTLIEPPQPGRLSHLSAASGLVCIGEFVYVVADDELHLGVFPRSGLAPGQLLPLFAGELPHEPKQRKKHKPDLEALTLLPPAVGNPHGALLALGSGSKPNRRRGAILPLSNTGALVAPVQNLQPDSLYEQLEARIGALNLEGAFVDGNDLVLLQRGNKKNRLNAVIRLSLADFMILLQGGRSADSLLRSMVEVDLGSVGDVPLAFTDGAALPNGDFIFSAVAENTDDSYNDGACLGAVMGVASPAGKLKYLEPLESSWKVEGVSALLRDGAIDVLLVTDADDEAIPAALLSARISVD